MPQLLKYSSGATTDFAGTDQHVILSTLQINGLKLRTFWSVGAGQWESWGARRLHPLWQLFLTIWGGSFNFKQDTLTSLWMDRTLPSVGSCRLLVVFYKFIPQVCILIGYVLWKNQSRFISILLLAIMLLVEGTRVVTKVTYKCEKLSH